MKSFIYKFLFLFLIGIFQMSLNAQVVINEYSASNLSTVTDNYSSYEDWVELFNTGFTAVDLSGYYLSDKRTNPTKWSFPEGTTISSGSFLKVWISGRDVSSGTNYHTNFKLTQTKTTPEFIVFSNPDGTLIEEHELAITRKDHSRGRVENGGEEWGIFVYPTPGSSNNSATAYTRYAEKPVMDKVAGFHPLPITVTISCNEPNSQIHYTTDGAKPISTSPVYTDPINVSETTIIKALAISNDPDILRGLTDFNTYFIGITHELAVMSTSAAQLDNLLNGNQSLKPFGTFEYFNKEGERTTFGYGEFNEHGQDSWVHDQRSIDYISRDECGYNYAIREAMIPITDRDEFQRIILRAAGDDNYPGIDTSALLRDFFVQNTACRENMHLDVRKGEKGLLYVNGIFWGIYGYREKVSDHDFTNYYYNQGKYDIYFLKLWGGSWAEYGGQAAWDDWNTLHDFIKYNDMSNQDNYEYVKTQLDYKSLVDYIIINSFVVCSDWINWNVGWWKGTNPEGGHQKWGYILWDEDATFAHYINYTGVPGISPYVPPCFPEGLTSDPEQHIVLLNRLRNNAEFTQYYISRYIDLYNTAFQPARMIEYLDSIEEKMLPEMHNHVGRWGGTVVEWRNNVQKIRNFVTNRHGYFPEGLEGCYDITGPYPINVSVEPADAGLVHLNSLVLEEFPWEGNYFGGIDIKLKAVSTNPNFEFDQWVLENHTVFPSNTSSEVVLDLSMEDNIIATFKPRILTDSLVINEINYHPADDFDPGDWVEIYNPMSTSMDLTNWEFKDEDDAHIFTFPENTIIEPFGFLVLCCDSAAFEGLFPEVNNFIGQMDFAFSGGGELLRLFDPTGYLVDFVEYDDVDPWPTEPDGNGPTLELINAHLDNALAESWAASDAHGTPGAVNSVHVIFFANFEAEPLFGNPPLTVQFTDLSESETPITSWQWDFDNDGTIDSEEQNPEWIYNENGNFSVALTISDGTLQDTKVKLNYILVETNEQQITLKYGYSFVSSRILHTNPDILEVLESVLTDDLDFVRNSEGQTLLKIGPNWINGIGDWNTTEGYLFRMNADDQVNFEGGVINPSSPINLHEGYQFISYLPEYAGDAVMVFESILNDNLQYIRNSDGNVLRKIGPNWVNGIGDAVPGEGYLIKMYSDDILIYNVPENTKKATFSKPLPTHFSFEGGNPADPVYSIYVEGLETGDEIAILDNKSVVGYGKVYSDKKLQNCVAVFSTLNNEQGFKSGNQVSAKVWDSELNKEVPINVEYLNPYGDAWLESTFPSDDGEYSIFNITKNIVNENTVSQINVYPNPAKNLINIVSNEIMNKVEVFNSSGKSMIINIENSDKIQINVSNLKTGLYFISIQTPSKRIIEKVTIQ